MASYKKYPKLVKVLAGTNGNESFEDLAEETDLTPQALFDEYASDTDDETLSEIEESISENESLFETWGWELPMEGDYEEFDDLAEANDSIRTFYNLIAERDGTDKFGEY